MRRLPIHWLTALLGPVLLALPLGWDGHNSAGADGNAPDDGQPVALPHRPLPPDMVEGFGEGRILAFHYHLSYYCATTPGSDVDGPFGHGDGHPESEDPKEYQVPPCFFGDTGTGSILPPGLQIADSPPVRKLFGIAPNFGGSPFFTNNTATDVQTQCSQPGPPVTQFRGPLGTCLMHPSTLRMAQNPDDPARQTPDPFPLPQHSHVIEGTSHPAGWWNAIGVNIADRSIWPDNDGHCPAGPPHCVTSVAALRAAQAKGLASPDIPSNLYLFFSVSPEAGGS